MAMCLHLVWCAKFGLKLNFLLLEEAKAMSTLVVILSRCPHLVCSQIPSRIAGPLVAICG